MDAAEFPTKLKFLFEPAPYKVIFGGRYGFKSWSVARALLLLGISKPIRVLCAREVQVSIKASVHQILEDQIRRMEIGANYDVLESEIRGANGTKFIFTGLATHTSETIKSYEDIDICWVEEGQAITERSWQMLDFTVRKEGAEVWVTFNPSLESDPTYQRFVVNPPPGAVVVKTSWRDAPPGWYTDTIHQKRIHFMETNPDDYPNIFDGECRPAVEGAIYFREIQSMEGQGRIGNVPYDPMLRAHVVIDLGYNDEMAIAVVQKLSSEIRIIRYIEDTQRTLDDYSAELKALKYSWGKVWLPFSDGFSRDFKTGKGADQIMRMLGWDVARKDQVANIDVETGIKLTRMILPRCYVDKTHCGQLVESLKRYKRHVNRVGEPGSPVHDSASHAGDCMRYMAINIDNMTNDMVKRQRPGGVSYDVLDEAVGY
jgi:phage terminase large subunit